MSTLNEFTILQDINKYQNTETYENNYQENNKQKDYQYNDYEQDNNDLEWENDELEWENDDLERENDELEQENDDLEQENDNFKQENDDLEQEQVNEYNDPKIFDGKKDFFSNYENSEFGSFNSFTIMAFFMWTTKHMICKCKTIFKIFSSLLNYLQFLFIYFSN